MVHRVIRPTSEDRRTAADAIRLGMLAATACGCLGETGDRPDVWVTPQAEVCNGLDDDGDGMSDEEYPPRPVCPLVYDCRDPARCECAPSHVRCMNTCYTRSWRFADCGGRRCVDLESDEMNCGACGRRCGPGMSCISDLGCVCTALVCDGVCTPHSEENCGACGRRCPPNAYCDHFAGDRCACVEPDLPCGPDGACIPFSDENCWGCGGRCPYGTYCTGRSCAAR